MKCKKCGKEMVTDDYGYYCCNVNCENYDVTIFAYERRKK